MNYSQILKLAKSTIEFTFTDKMTVTGLGEETEDEFGATVPASTVTKYENEPCRIDFLLQNNDNPNKDGIVSNPILWRPRVFAKAGTKIAAGDWVKVVCAERENKEYEGTASDVCEWETHIEFLIGVKDDA